MLRPVVKPALDPLAFKSAIDAMEAQRAAYRRYARTVEAQRATFGDGDGDRATAAVDAAVRDFAELSEGARALAPQLQQVSSAGSAEQAAELQQQMEQLMREARMAEVAIRNMSQQLEAWRDAYGRQLAEVGLAPGSAGGPAPVGEGEGAPDAALPGDGGARPGPRSGPYGPRDGGRVSLIDRRG